LVATPGVLAKVNDAADALRKDWTDAYKAGVPEMDEKDRQAWRSIEGAGSKPEQTTMVMPDVIESMTAKSKWLRHIYVDEKGRYHQDFKSSWERKVVEAETDRDEHEIIGWLRNQDRKPWSLCIPREEGSKWVGIYPDFIFFRRTKSGVLAEIVDPHLLCDQYAPGRAAALAKYAKDHGERFGRIELVIYANGADDTGKRLNLMNEAVRSKVAQVAKHQHLQQLFDEA
jgi:type III restriction enzyme